MPTAILIGFEYQTNPLIGAIIDLYHATKWCQSFYCDIHILTDIDSESHLDNLRLAINKKIVGSDIETFFERSIKIKTCADLLDQINTISVEDKLIIYYSGHGMKNSMLFPDQTLLSFNEFRTCILKNLNPYTEVFWIMDCCNPSGLHLPFKLEGNKFRLSSSKIEPVTQPILLLMSAESNEKSVATNFGSLFSRNLFQYLTMLNNDDPITLPIAINKNRNLRRLIGNIGSSIRKLHTGYIQTISIYSSYITDPILWMWIGNKKNYDIVTDLTMSILIVRHNDANNSTIHSDNNGTIKMYTDISNPYDLIFPD